jgi:hypothetical protein
MPAYSGVANGDWVLKDVVPRPDDVTDDTMRSTERLNVCKGMGGGCVRYKQQLFCAYSSSGEACESSPLCTLR